MDIEPPICKYGYTEDQINRIVDDPANFWNWMYGQTGTICTGMRWSPRLEKYVKDCDEAHDMIVYSWDLERYLLGIPIVD